MNFYINMHPYYCGIDLHARILYVCILDQEGNTPPIKKYLQTLNSFKNYWNPT